MNCSGRLTYCCFLAQCGCYTNRNACFTAPRRCISDKLHLRLMIIPDSMKFHQFLNGSNVFFIQILFVGIVTVHFFFSILMIISCAGFGGAKLNTFCKMENVSNIFFLFENVCCCCK